LQRYCPKPSDSESEKQNFIENKIWKKVKEDFSKLVWEIQPELEKLRSELNNIKLLEQAKKVMADHSRIPKD
jgi:hypothetical protein